MTFQSPRGTRDILPSDQPGWRFVRETAERVAAQLAYQPITVPTYEEIGLFQRSIGEGTDVMDKELFLVRGIRSDESQPAYALRPEGTAGIVRSFIQHGMHTWPQPVKLYSLVNNFRYDRPQKGRYREHVQFDVEYLGDRSSFADAFIIFTSWRFLQEVGLEEIELHLNTLGTPEERATYIDALKAYFRPLHDQLSEDSQTRLELNPLRILDSKDTGDQKLREGAPQLIEFLSTESRTHFSEVEGYLTEWNIPYVLDPFLVRGLDYYCHTAFEWTVKNSLGQQNSLGGGGRYDGLIPSLGGPTTGAVGFGIGLDRVIEELERQGKTQKYAPPTPQVFIIAADPEGKKAALSVINQLSQAGIALDTQLQKEGMPAQLKAASRSGAAFAVICGQRELQDGQVGVKNLATGTQELVPLTTLTEYLRHA